MTEPIDKVTLSMDEYQSITDDLKELREALSVCVDAITEYHEYEHDGDPWTEDARAMGEMWLDELEGSEEFEKIKKLLNST